MNGDFITVIKDGELINIKAGCLAKGDIVVLQAGEFVPADLKLIEAKWLTADEFELTGEIMPVTKTVDDTGSRLLMGSRILSGTGKGIVTATGQQTEYGRVNAQVLKQTRPYAFRFFQKKYLLLLSLLAPAFVISLLQPSSPLPAIACYAMLSAAFLVLQNDELVWHMVLSRALKALEASRIQVRDIYALGDLDAIDTMCFDKTGVLTTRQMDVKSVFAAGRTFGADAPLPETQVSYLIRAACALCNDVSIFEKTEHANAVDRALISYAEKKGLAIRETFLNAKQMADKPLDSENRYMACSFALEDGAAYKFAKGDPEIILKMCRGYLSDTGTEKLGSDFRLSLKSSIDAISERGSTAIALACSKNADLEKDDYTFLCLLELENKLQRNAREVIKELTERKVRCIMLTGDRSETAVRIGEACGIADRQHIYLTGRTIERMDLAEVVRQAAYCSVFARLMPSQKAVLIRLLRQKGHAVAMIGDGPNDGLALKAANIGISFIYNSSPVARRLSAILINQLDDLPVLFRTAQKIRKRTKRLHALRIAVIIAALLVLYACVFGLL